MLIVVMLELNLLTKCLNYDQMSAEPLQNLDSFLPRIISLLHFLLCNLQFVLVLRLIIVLDKQCIYHFTQKIRRGYAKSKHTYTLKSRRDCAHGQAAYNVLT